MRTWILLCGCLWQWAWDQSADSMDRVIRAIARDSLRLEAIKGEIQRHYLAQPEEGMPYARWYAAEAQQLADERLLARSHNFLGLCHYSLNQIPEAIACYLRAFEAVQDSLFMGIALNNLAAAHKVRDKQAETIRYYQQALILFEAIDNQEWIVISKTTWPIYTWMIDQPKPWLPTRRPTASISNWA